MEKNPCTVTIGVVRFSYLNIWEPSAMEEGQPKKFSLSAIIPKSDKKTLAVINEAVEEAKRKGKETKWAGKIPAGLKLPLRDGDDRADDAAYQKSMFINCNAPIRPGIVDTSRKPIIDHEEIGSGDYGYVNITFYPFNAGGSKGVGVALNHVMKTKTGERLSGRVSIDDAFEDLSIDDETSSLL